MGLTRTGGGFGDGWGWSAVLETEGGKKRVWKMVMTGVARRVNPTGGVRSGRRVVEGE